ncbi:MAG: hypothetical protein AAGL89_00005 [Pseudomonadota bacterium]
MPQFRCMPLAGGHVPPQFSGSALGGPRHWDISDEGAVSGNILRLDVSGLPVSPDGFKLTHFEIALSQRGGTTTVRRVLGGPATNYSRRFKIDLPESPQRAQIRAVWQRLNQLTWRSKTDPKYVPQIGDPIIQSATGASGTVRGAVSLGGGSYYLIVDDMIGSFEDETETFVAGNTGNQGSALHCTHVDEFREPLVSEYHAAATIH